MADGGAEDLAAAAATANAAAVSGVSDVLEERRIDTEYKIWKKNTPYLYDLVMTHALEWPSLTCQWLPNVKDPVSTPSTSIVNATREHSLLLGTHTTGEQNYLMVASVQLPVTNDVGNSLTPLISPDKNSNSTEHENGGEGGNNCSMPPNFHFDEDKKEVGGYGFCPPSDGGREGKSKSGTGLDGKVEIKMKICHDGEVNRARYNPFDSFVIATKGPSPLVNIFDMSKHPSVPALDGIMRPNLVLRGHDKEGYGLAWSSHSTSKGHIISGSEDCQVCHWDIHAKPQQSHSNDASSKAHHGLALDPLSVFKGHTKVVEDVAWHKLDPNLIGSCGDDITVRLWDVREANGGSSGSANVIEKAHEGDVHCLSFHPSNGYLLATGSADKTVALWDMRNLKSRLQTLSGHTDQVFQVSWAPFNEVILASCSADRRVNVWDISRTGLEQTAEDAEDGPPELLFIHGGHTAKVSDFSWNPHNNWTIASVSEDNVLQLWSMAEEIYAEDEEGDDDQEEEESKNEDDVDDGAGAKKKQKTDENS